MDRNRANIDHSVPAPEVLCNNKDMERALFKILAELKAGFKLMLVRWRSRPIKKANRF